MSYQIERRCSGCGAAEQDAHKNASRVCPDCGATLCVKCGHAIRGIDADRAYCWLCKGATVAYEWWLVAQDPASESAPLLGRIRELMARKAYSDVIAMLSPLEGLIADTPDVVQVLREARDCYLHDGLLRIRQCIDHDYFDTAISQCQSLRVQYGQEAETFARLAHEICLGLTSRSRSALSSDDWQNARLLAEKALVAEPGNEDATQLQAECAARLHLKDLAARALAAYRARDTASCENACGAFLAFQRGCGIHVEFTDASGGVIDFSGLPGKLSQEIAAEIAARRRAKRVIILRRCLKLAAACTAVVILVMTFGHWRVARFEKRVRAFDTAFRAQAYDTAKAIAPKIAGKYALAADLLAYFRARAAFETAFKGMNTALLQQHGAATWGELQTQKQTAEASVGSPVKGVEAYQRAATLLTECQTLANSGETARKEKELRERAIADAKVKEEREQAERKRVQAERDAEQLRARVRKDVDAVAASMSQNNPMGNAVEGLGSAAVPSWRTAADNGWGEGQILMGLCYQFGIHVGKDSAKGRTLIQKAAEQGIGLAEFCMAVDIDTRRNPESRGEMISWMKRAAEHGVAQAQATLGGWYVEGYGSLSKDTEEAAKWFKLAAENGNASAQHQLGVCYFYGVGVMKDVDEALKWIRLAARNGEPFAQYSLSTMYRSGTGVEEDTSQALEWCKKAAAQGHAGAQNDLGVAYLRGDGVYKNVNEAVRWFRLAAQQGNETAISNLQDLNVAPSGWLYKCSRCGRVEKYSRKVVTAACSQCISGDMQLIGPAY